VYRSVKTTKIEEEDRIRAMLLYSLSAEVEEHALEALDSSKTRMLGTDSSVRCVRFVLMRSSRPPPVKVLVIQELHSLQSASSASD
jgi:hypothetical protein